MKRIIAFLIVAVMCMSFVACGQSKEERAANAMTLNWSQALKAKSSNIAAAMKEYNNKTVKWTSTVRFIKEDYVCMSDELDYGAPENYIYVYMSQDELAELSKGETITVVGTLKLLDNYGNDNDAEIKNAFIVK